MLTILLYWKRAALVFSLSLCLVCPGYAAIEDVTLQWDESIDAPYLQSYKIYYYTTPGDAGSLNPADYAASYTLAGGTPISINPLTDRQAITIDKSNTQITLPLDNLKTYYFVATAVDTRGLESIPTPEVNTKRLLMVSLAGIGGSGAGTVAMNDGGMINCGADCSKGYVFGTNVRLTAMPDAVSIFMGWSGATCTGIGDCLVTMDVNKNVTASFALKGDIDGDGALSLADLILALKITARISSLGIYPASVGNDRKIGVDEAIYILQTIAGFRN